MCKLVVRQYVINPHKSFQSDDFIWRHVTLLFAAHNHTHWRYSNQQHAGSVDVLLSSTRLPLPDILRTITTCNITSERRSFLNPPVYCTCIAQTFLLTAMFLPPSCNIDLNQWVHVKWAPSLFWDNVCCQTEFVEQRFGCVCWSQLQRPGDHKLQE